MTPISQRILLFALADGAMSQGPTFGASHDSTVQPMAVQVAGDKIVQFSSPETSVTVWQ